MLGKTFLGIRAARILVKHLQNNLKGEARPIVCITYTNHALDQFLEGLLPDIPDLVRIGGRSKSENEKLKERNLNMLVEKHADSRMKALNSDLFDLKQQVEDLWEEHQQAANNSVLAV